MREREWGKFNHFQYSTVGTFLIPSEYKRSHIADMKFYLNFSSSERIFNIYYFSMLSII